MLKKALHFVKRRPGLSLLLLILTGIIAKTLNINLYVIGWDNFSSYFNPVSNIFRTFFATWRQYRGLGSASDSEAVDIFRQIFCLILRPVLPEPLLDQTYMMTCLVGGVLGMYYFAYHFLKTSTDKEKSHYLAELFGFVAAFFYLFNLNTAATFTFPMIMYITRFMSIPILLIIFYTLIHSRSVSRLRYCAYIVAIFFLSGSYITGTILITTCMIIWVFGLFQGKLKRFLWVFAFFITINVFWLLPFANYTVQKSKLIRLAPTFISANETQANKPKDFFSARKQLLLYSNFFDTKYSDIKDPKIKYYFHTFSKLYEHPLTEAVLWVFPFLYIAGAVLLLLKRKKRWLWIPFTLILFLILSMKEYSFFGFLYRFLSNLTPFFDVLFRFSDTKFHVYIAFAASLSAGYTFVYIAEKSRKIALGAMILVSVLFLIVFRDYFLGRFIGTFMYNKVPEAYFQIAEYLNRDKGSFRILHLPYDKDVYWKSYTWGMVGSSFFNFMLDHPLIDKTFEPASMENGYLDKSIRTLLTNIQSIPSWEEKRQRAESFAALLAKTGVKYIVFDDTVRAGIPSKGIVYWGEFNNPDVRAMMDVLKHFGMAETVKNYTVDLSGYDRIYGENYPLSDEKKRIFEENKKSGIELIKLKNSEGAVTFPTRVSFIDSTIDNILETPLMYQEGHFIQDEKAAGVDIYPFMQQKATLSAEDGIYSLQLPAQQIPTGNLRVVLPGLSLTPDNVLQYIDIYARQEEQGAVISFNRSLTPGINDRRLSEKLSEIHIPKKALATNSASLYSGTNIMSDWAVFKDKIGSLRLRINNIVMPLPSVFQQADQYMGTVAVSGPHADIGVLALGGESSIPLRNVALTENPNCFNDKLPGSAQSLSRGTALTLKSKNQSTCTLVGLGKTVDAEDTHIDFQIRLSSKHTDTDSKKEEGMDLTSKPLLRKYMTEQTKPNMMYFCVKPEGFDEGCFNSRQIMDVGSGEQVITIPLEKPINGVQNFSTLLSLKNTGYQEQELRLSSIIMRHYRTILSAGMDLSYPVSQTASLPSQSTPESSLTITFPQALSAESFYFKPATGGMFVANSSCEQVGGYRTFRMVKGEMVSYIENCNNSLYIPADFDSSHFYFWTLDYNLLSGKFPQLYVDDNFYAYSTGMVSLYQGYPDVPGFKSFQKPEMWYDKYAMDGTSYFDRAFTALPLAHAYGYLNSQPELEDHNAKKYEIKHDTENEGIIAVSSFSTQPLPSQWEFLKLSMSDTRKDFFAPSSVMYSSLLPSLRKVTVRMDSSGQYLMRLSEGYDKQWQAYTGWSGVILGIGESIKPVRCDGFANCYQITQKEGDPAVKTFYIFYTPERLSVLGWLGTIAGILYFGRRFRKTLLSSKDEKQTS